MKIKKTKEEILQLLLGVIEETNLLKKKKDQLPLSPDLQLVGAQTSLDSLGFLNLIVAIENALQQELSLSISLSDSTELGDSDGPFRSLDSLADYILQLMQNDVTGL